MKHAVRDIVKQNLDQLVVSFFVHGRGLELQKTPLGLFRALLNSLLGHFPTCLEKLTAVFEDRERRFGGYQANRWSWKHQELQELFSELLVKNTQSRQVTIFVDALDELGEEHARDLLAYFRVIAVQAIDDGANFKICFSSRHYPILGLDTFPTISVEKKNRVDIQWYVNNRLAKMSFSTRRDQIQKEIMAKAKGGFQWVFLVIQTLIDRNLEGRSLAGHVTACPLTLSKMYTALLSSGSQFEKKQTLKLFQWVLFAERPLSSQELREALRTDAQTSCTTVAALRSCDAWSEGLMAFERYVRNISRGLVEFRTRDFWEHWEDSDREVQFIHQSVADYLLEDYAKPHEERLEGKGHFQISRSCLKYLTMGDVLSRSGLPRDELSSSFPLAPYAVRYFFVHIRKAEEAGIDQRDLLLAFKWPSPLETAHRLGHIWNTLNSTNAGTPPGWPFPGSPDLHILIALGSPSVVKAAMEEEMRPVNDVDPDGNTSLHIAIATGYQDVALELLRQQHEWQSSSRYSTLRRPSLPEPSSAFSALLDFNVKNKEDETPLDSAVAMKCHTIIDDLIELGADLKLLSQPYLLVCHAITKEDKGLLAKLIAGDINLVGALYFAIENGSSKEIVQALAEGGGDLNRLVTTEANNFDGDDEAERNFRRTGGNALHLACLRGLDAEVNILLANGASAIACDNYGQCPLHIAVSMRDDDDRRRCSLETIACLLEYEPTAVEIEDDDGKSPLMRLAGFPVVTHEDSKVLVMLLLTTMRLSLPSTALTKFFLRNHGLWKSLGMEAPDAVRASSIVESMDLTAKTRANQSILWLAAANGLSVLLDSLLARGSVDVNESDTFGTLPLHAAVKGGHVNAVRSLLAADKINVNAQDHQGFSPLCAAVGHSTSSVQDYKDGHEILTLLLAAPGIYIDLKDGDGPLLLVLAAGNGCGTCIARLLDSVGNTSDVSNMPVTKALFVAFRAGNMEAVSLLLLRKDIVGNITPSERQLLLHIPNQTPAHDLFSRLPHTPTSVTDAEDQYGMLLDANTKLRQTVSPLLETVQLGSRANVGSLITVEGFDVNAQDEEGLSLLLAAVRRMDADIVEILLTNKTIDVNVKDRYGMSPLLCASMAECCKKNSAIIDLLLMREGVHISDVLLAVLLLYDEKRRKFSGGDSMLWTAIKTDNLRLIALLVEKGGFDVNVLGRDGYSALRLAAERPDKTIFKYLVARRQTDLDIEDAWGLSLLSCAAEVGTDAVVMALLDTERVNPYHRGRSGLMPLQKAQQNGHLVIATMLQAQMDVTRMSPVARGTQATTTAFELTRPMTVQQFSK